MHGLILRTLQIFIQDTYGYDSWEKLAHEADLDPPNFEAMLHYDPTVLNEVLRAARVILNKPRDVFLEDVGIYLVSHPNCEALRRLLRFGGVDFIEFIYSLDDLPDRARLAVADLELPDLTVEEQTPERFTLRLSGGAPGFSHVMVGMLRAMADDYGALALFENDDSSKGAEAVTITLVETCFTKGKSFELGRTDPTAAEGLEA